MGYAKEAEKVPFTAKTICQLASMTKPIASAACLQLLEKGLYLLTDPVADYIPEFKDHKVYSYSPRGDLSVVPAKKTVTVGHLFDMTSGVTVDWGWNNPNSQELARRMEEAKARGVYNLQEFAKAAGETPGAFEAGEHYYYGQSLDVAAALLEILTGQTFGDYLKEHRVQVYYRFRKCIHDSSRKRGHLSPGHQGYVGADSRR